MLGGDGQPATGGSGPGSDSAVRVQQPGGVLVGHLVEVIGQRRQSGEDPVQRVEGGAVHHVPGRNSAEEVLRSLIGQPVSPLRTAFEGEYPRVLGDQLPQTSLLRDGELKPEPDRVGASSGRRPPAVRSTPLRRAGRSRSGTRRVQGAFQDVTGQRLERGIGPDQTRLPSTGRRIPAQQQRVPQSDRQAGGDRQRQGRQHGPVPLDDRRDGGAQGGQTLQREGLDVAVGAEGGLHLGHLFGHLVRFDAELGVAGAGLLLLVGGR